MNRPIVTRSVIPNLFTAMNMFCGYLSMINSSEQNYFYAAWLIIIAAIFDALDGFAARLTNSSSELGVELDSLSDVVSFGAAPGFLIYSVYLNQFEVFGVLLSSLLLIAGGFRLARFNVQLVGFSKTHFTGLPIPSSGITVALFILAYIEKIDNKNISLVIIPMVILLSILMVSKIKYDTIPKISLNSFKQKPLPFLFLLAFIVLLISTSYTGLFFTFVFVILFGIFRQMFNWFRKKKK